MSYITIPISVEIDGGYCGLFCKYISTEGFVESNKRWVCRLFNRTLECREFTERCSECKEYGE